MRQKTLSVQCENILPIIKKWLYSSHDIFLRELISNACDAIKKLRLLTGEQGDLPIHVRIDKKNKTLAISDQGIGMTEEEVERYIAQIAFSGAEEFLAKYQKDQEAMIGHFGLGFYSAYMVASKVELETRSYLPDAPPVHWSCDGSANYEIGPGSRTERGTDVILYLDDAYLEYLEEPTLRDLIQRFCGFMPESIFLNDKSVGTVAPLWLKTASDCTDKEYLDFYRKLFPLEPDPLFWIHLNIDYPFRLKGILYLPKQQRRFEEKTDSIRLYCNRVFVSDHSRDILPDYLTVMRGALDSPELPLNVSRSNLQVDQNVKQLGTHISKKVSDRLNVLFKNDRAHYCALWPELELLVKLGLLQDEKFYDRVKDLLIWKTSKNEWSTVQELLDRSREQKIVYTTEQSAVSLQKVFLDRGVELLYIRHPLDSAVLNALERKLAPVKFQRIDSALDEKLIDAAKEQGLLDADGKTVASRIAQFFKAQLEDKLEVEAKSLASNELAAVFLLDEESRRFRDYLALTSPNDLAAATLGKRTFVVNTNHKLVQLAWKLAETKPDIAKNLAQQIYDFTRLAHKEIEGRELDQLVAREHALLEQLLCTLYPFHLKSTQED
jgi:molecular chaperone HtpG